MEFNQYNTTVQQWIHTVLENRETNADVVLECCRDIIAYGRETDDPKLMGFGFFYGGEIYYELNDGAHFFHMMTEALTYLDRAEEWELVVRCYNFLGIASMSRGNPSLALDYYMNGLKDSDTYDLPHLFPVSLHRKPVPPAGSVPQFPVLLPCVLFLYPWHIH